MEDILEGFGDLDGEGSPSWTGAQGGRGALVWYARWSLSPSVAGYFHVWTGACAGLVTLG